MREILFRGQRIDNGEWVYGYISKTRRLNKPDQLFEEMVYHIEDWVDKMILEQVKPETIGQFTGIVDKNGNKIFEGDKVLVSIKNWEKEIKQVCEVVFNEFGFSIKHENGRYTKLGGLEIIGNIHEEQLIKQATEL